MTVAPLIAMKSSQVKSFDAVGRELDRRAHTYANDVDQSGRHIGYRCRAEDERPVPLERAVERRMGELKTKRKVRENQVRAMGFIVSSNDALDEKTAREFLDRSINWFGARYGYERPRRHERRSKGYRSLEAYKGCRPAQQGRLKPI